MKKIMFLLSLFIVFSMLGVVSAEKSNSDILIDLQNVITSKYTNFSGVSLDNKNFDLNNDNQINALDLNLLVNVRTSTSDGFFTIYIKLTDEVRKRVGSKTGESLYIEGFDVNRDGTIAKYDLDKISNVLNEGRSVKELLLPGIRSFFKVFKGEDAFDANFDVWPDGRINSVDLSALNGLGKVDSKQFEEIYTKLSIAVSDRMNLKDGDSKYVAELDFNSDGTITTTDLEIMQSALKEGISIYPASCSETDLTGDNIVNAFDLLRLRQCMSNSSQDGCSKADINKNGYMGYIDLDYVRNYYRQGCSSETPQNNTQTNQTQEATCTDSDGGKDYFKKGISSSPNDYQSDYCHLGTLREYYCEGDKLKSTEYECPFGCSSDFVACAKEKEDVDEILVKGRLMDKMTGKPISGAKLYSAYEFSPSEVITDSEGNFQFKITTEFKLTEGQDKGKSDFGGGWTFLAECYGWADSIGVSKRDGKIIATIGMFDSGEKTIDLTGKEFADLGEIYAWPHVDISIKTDIPASFDVMYKYKNSQGYNGPGQSGYTEEHYLTDAIPLDYDVFIRFYEESKEKHDSSTYHIPSNAMCGTVFLKYINNNSDWSMISKINPDENSGPIELPKEIKDDKEFSSSICTGCVLEDKCYPFGYRKSGEYCSDSNTFVKQTTPNSACENNFECSSNVCVSNQCISEGLIQKVLNWFKRVFGKD